MSDSPFSEGASASALTPHGGSKGPPATLRGVMSVTIRNIGNGAVESNTGCSVNPGVWLRVKECLQSKRKPGVVGGPVRDIDDGGGNVSAQRDCLAHPLPKG